MSYTTTSSFRTTRALQLGFFPLFSVSTQLRSATRAIASNFDVMVIYENLFTSVEYSPYFSKDPRSTLNVENSPLYEHRTGYLSSDESIATSDKAQYNDLKILLRTGELRGMTGVFGNYTHSCILILRL